MCSNVRTILLPVNVTLSTYLPHFISYNADSLKHKCTSFTQVEMILVVVNTEGFRLHEVIKMQNNNKHPLIVIIFRNITLHLDTYVQISNADNKVYNNNMDYTLCQKHQIRNKNNECKFRNTSIKYVQIIL